MATNAKGKVVLIGDFNVGKTSMFTRFKMGVFPEEPPDETRRESDCKKTIIVDGKPFEFTLHDTAGLERYEGTVPPSYFRSAGAVMFVYAVDNRESIANVINWSDGVSPQRLDFVGTSRDIVRTLVGNKDDVTEDNKVVHIGRARETAELCGIKENLVFEISAKDGSGFDELFVSVAREIMKRNKTREEGNDSGSPTVNLRDQKVKAVSGSGCCS